MAELVGPLRARFRVDTPASQPPLLVPAEHLPAATLVSANGRLLLHRTAVLMSKVSEGQASDDLDFDDRPIYARAAEFNLGQGPGAGSSSRDDINPLLGAAEARRHAALAVLKRTGRVNVRTLELEVRGALVTGTGAGGVRDVGIELHTTYGWPILPGSSLKGVAREYARQTGHPNLEAIFGSAPEAEDQTPGSVAFFDALPWRHGIEVVVHSMTPHTRGYRSDPPASGPIPPGESISPVPIAFLALQRGRFVAQLAGPEPYVEIAADLLEKAVDDLGVGAKTASGYGYLIKPMEPRQGRKK
jgi:CRISPR/Cas system CMR subunit Cmr6 (Cas7 group RAMP superfamily)